MGHKLRSASLCIAVFAIVGVVGASTAVAAQFTASLYPATATGSAAQGEGAFTTEAGSFECAAHFEGSFSAASSTLAVAPQYTKCQAFGYLTATVTPEGCTYVLQATEGSAGVYNNHVDISCASGKSIKIEAGTCKVEIKGQTGLTKVRTTNSGSSIMVRPEITGIGYTVTADGFGCPFAGTGNKSGGTITGELLASRVGGGSISVSG